MQHREAALRLRLGIADGIGIRHSSGGDKLFLSKGLDGLHAVPQLGGPLEFQGFRGRVHLLPDLLRYGFVTPGQKRCRLPDPLQVFRLIRHAPAPAVTVPHLIIQAGTVLPDGLGKFLSAARELEGQTKGVDNFLRQIPAAVGTEITGPVLQDLCRQHQRRVWLGEIQAKIREAFIVLQQDVVLRHIPLDQAAFQHQRLEFGSGDDDVKMVYLGYHQPGLRTVGRGVDEILTDPVFQLLGFPDIDDLICLVLHEVNPGRKRKGQRGLPQFFFGQRNPPE